MITESRINTILNTAALQSPPHARYAPIGPGSVQGGLCRYPHNPPYAEKDIMPS